MKDIMSCFSGGIDQKERNQRYDIGIPRFQLFNEGRCEQKSKNKFALKCKNGAFEHNLVTPTPLYCLTAVYE